jgi:hypothetical protein
VREANESDAEWQKKERDHAPIQMAYDLQKQKWINANKKCVAVIKNTIEHTIMGSIQECDTVTEYLERIKSQFYGSSKTYATQFYRADLHCTDMAGTSSSSNATTLPSDGLHCITSTSLSPGQ